MTYGRSEEDNVDRIFEVPHSIAIWIRWELHERKPDGKLSGAPQAHKNYSGVLNFENKEEAMKTINELLNKIKMEIDNVRK